MGKILETITTDYNLSDKQRVYSGLPVGWFRQIFILLSSAGHTLFSGMAGYPSLYCFTAVLMVMLVHWCSAVETLLFIFHVVYFFLCCTLYCKTNCPLEMNKVELTPNIILFLKVEFMAIG